MLSTVGRFIYTKYWGILYVEHCGKIYLHKILRNIVCWALWEYLFTQNTGKYFMLNNVGRFIYTKYWGILYVEHCGKIYLHKNRRNTLCWTICGKIYLHKILRNTVCWALWEDLFTQNTEEYFMLSTVGRFIYIKYLGIWYVEDCGKIYLINKLLQYFMLNTVGRFIYTKYWGILHVEHCGKISFHKLLGNTVCWTLWGDLFTQITGEYFMLNTVRRFIYTKYWEIFYVEHCGNIYLHKILVNNLCWTLWEYSFTHKYWEIHYVEHCEKIYLHKIPRNIVCWALWEDLFTQNTEDYFMLNTVGRFIYTKYWGILYVEHCGEIYLHKILRNTSCWTLWEYLFT